MVLGARLDQIPEKSHFLSAFGQKATFSKGKTRRRREKNEGILAVIKGKSVKFLAKFGRKPLSDPPVVFEEIVAEGGVTELVLT